MKIKAKKAVSLLISFSYGIVLFGLGFLIVSVIVESHKFIGLFERYNMAYYGAESGIEQGLFELGLHDIGFSDSSKNYDTADTSGFSPLFGNRVKYLWKIKGRESGAQTGFLIQSRTPIKIEDEFYNSKNKDFYRDFKRFYFYYDKGVIGSGTILENLCLGDDVTISLSTSGSSLNMDNRERIIYWRANKSNAENGTGFVLESSEECVNGSETNPFCYTSADTFTNNSELKTNTNNKGVKSDTNGKIYENKENINSFFNNPTTSVHKPFITLIYSKALYEDRDKDKKVPIKYVFSGCDKEFPSLVSTITSIGKVSGSIQKLQVKKSQGDGGFFFDYVISQ